MRLHIAVLRPLGLENRSKEISALSKALTEARVKGQDVAVMI
jgi:hypothetical protein